jgi:hypothetical protein
MRRVPDKDRIALIAEQHLRAQGAGEPKVLRVELVTLDPQRKEMLRFMKTQQMTREERKAVLRLYRGRPRQEWSLLFQLRDPKYENGTTGATVKLDIMGVVTDVRVIPRPRGVA